VTPADIPAQCVNRHPGKLSRVGRQNEHWWWLQPLQSDFYVTVGPIIRRIKLVAAMIPYSREVIRLDFYGTSGVCNAAFYREGW